VSPLCLRDARLSPDKELAKAKGQARVAKDTGVHHVIWSTLEDTGK